jgi:hypothetical protein
MLATRTNTPHGERAPITGDAAYRTVVEANYVSIVPSYGPSEWDMEKQDAVLYYTRLNGASNSVGTTIPNQFVTNIMGNSDQWPMVTGNQDSYRAPMKDVDGRLGQ